MFGVEYQELKTSQSAIGRSYLYVLFIHINDTLKIHFVWVVDDDMKIII